MRGTDETSGSLFSYVDLEERDPAGHPLGKIRQIVKDASVSLDAEFDALYTDFGHPFIALQNLIRTSLMQILFSIRRVTPEACLRHDTAVDGADGLQSYIPTVRRGRYRGPDRG